MPWADCRKCVYFIPKSVLEADEGWYLREPWIDMSKDEFKGMLEEIAVREAKGERHLGLCRKRRKPVYYYEGRCRYFKPKKVWKQLTLEEVLKPKR